MLPSFGLLKLCVALRLTDVATPPIGSALPDFSACARRPPAPAFVVAPFVAYPGLHMSDTQLIIVDPGHFHAALVQRRMYAGISPQVRVYAPLGPDLIDYLTRIARFNADPRHPTDWRLEIYAGTDFLDHMREMPTGNIAIFSGRNRGKIDRIAAALALGMHVLADKPVIIRREDLPALEAALATARAKRLIFCDMMTGRHDVIADVLRLLRRDPEVYGDQLAGTRATPGVAMTSVHHLLKRVAGVPNPRPAWYFDVTEQGEALADIGTHLVDRAHRTLFPDMALDHHAEIRVEAAETWPTIVGAGQFAQLTGEARWPAFLEEWVKGDALEYRCNGRTHYRVRGVEVMLDVRWHWEAATGEDTHDARYCGSRARLELRQGAAERWRPEIYVVANADIGRPLQRRIQALQVPYPGIGLEKLDREWHVVVPETLRVGHEAHFAMLMRGFLDHVTGERPLPVWEAPNMLAKYCVCTESVAIARRRAGDGV